MKILIGADVVPTATNEIDFINGNAENLLGSELKKIVDSADFIIANLEVPLTNVENKLTKSGPNLIAKEETINGYKALGIDLLCLANNHVLDQGKQGFLSTLRVLKENNFAYIGGGESQEEACKPYVIESNGKFIGVYNCCEHEFSWARDYGIGSNGFDPFESLDEIYNLKQKVDYCIVLYHGGREEYRYPSPYLRKATRKMIDKGADLVICQHTHCVGCEEDYNGGKIIYGQGNFIFDHAGRSEAWETSILITIDTEDDYKIDYIPIEKNVPYVKLSNNADILKGYFDRTEEIKEDGFILRKYKEFSLRNYPNAFGNFVNEDVVKGPRRKAFENYMRCEPHREAILIRLEVEDENDNV